IRTVLMWAPSPSFGGFVELAEAERGLQVLALHIGAPGEVGQRAGYAQRAVDGARAQVAALRHEGQKRRRRAVEVAPAVDLARAELRVRAEPRAAKPPSLSLACGDDPRAHDLRALAGALFDQLEQPDVRHRDLQVEAVEERPGEPPAIA